MRFAPGVYEEAVLRLGRLPRADDDDFFQHLTALSFGVSFIEGNLLLNEGIAEMWDIIIGAGTPTKYDNTNAQLGVGSDATAENATQTDLIDGTPTWKGMETSYPSRSGQAVTWRSVFGTADANEAWNEFSVRNGVTANKNMNRKVSAQGTKAAGQTWTLDLQITLS